jgi:hypothetical protein
MSSQPNPVPHPWRRFLRFSVRGLIVLVLVIGAALGWIIREAHVQRDAAAAISRACGSVSYSFGSRDGSVLSRLILSCLQPDARQWAVDAIGIDYFANVDMVVFPRGCTDKELVFLAPFARLYGLNVRESSVTDAGLVHLKG